MNYKFSILIPYHADYLTVDFIKRQLNYYHLNTTSMLVVLLASGNQMVNLQLQEFIEKFNDPRLSIIINHENDITNYKSFIKKISNGLKIITTPYVVINGADDVIIPEIVCKGIELLSNNLDIAGVKGHTIYFNCESGSLFFSKDLGITDDIAINRIKLAIKDLDSIFYIIRRTIDLSREYMNIDILSDKTHLLDCNPYHIEHFKALSIAALGKVYVLDLPWRIQTSHKNNHTSHTQASFIRIQSGILDKSNYIWFQSVTKNMNVLSYNYYKFLWICHQITGISATLKQIVYNFIHKKCGLIDSIHVFIYFILNKLYICLRKFLPKILFKEKIELYGNAKFFVESKYYPLLKKHYFTENDIQLLEFKKNNFTEKVEKSCK